MKHLIFALTLLGIQAQAALSPAFHNAPLKTYSESVETFGQQRLGPVTFAIYYAENSALLTAGSYDAAHYGDVVLSTIAKEAMAKTFSDMSKRGFAPFQLSVAVSKSAQNLFSILFTKDHPATESHFNMTETQFTQIYNDATKVSGLRPLDHVEWTEGGQNLHTMVFAKDGLPFAFFYGLEKAAFEQKIKDLDAQDMELTTFHAGISAHNRLLFSGVWLQKTHKNTVVYLDQTPTMYQQRFTQLSAIGMQLRKVVGYENHGGVVLGGIWAK